MPIYTYDREFGDTIHFSPAVHNVDHEGEATPIADRVDTDLPGKHFVARCDGAALEFDFEETLTQGEQDTLTASVAAHKAVDDWPPV